MRSAISAVVVAYGDPPAVLRAVASLQAQTRPPEQLIVVDNHPEHEAAAALDAFPGVRIIRAADNGGYTGGAALGAAAATGDYLLFCNPDAVMDEDALRVLADVMDSRPAAAVVGAHIVLPDGTTNAGDNPIHFTGLSWAGRYRQPAETGPPRQVASASGCAMLVRAEDFRALNGFCPEFFLYCDDTDFCWRARLAGREVWLCPQATVTHDYDFDKGPGKWHYLERNRWWMLLSNYRWSTMLMLSPLLAGTEAALLLVSARQGWLRQKLAAYADVLGAANRIRRWRASVQLSRTLSDGAFLPWTAGRVDTPVLDSPLLRAANPGLERYRRAAVLLTRLVGR